MLKRLRSNDTSTTQNKRQWYTAIKEAFSKPSVSSLNDLAAQLENTISMRECNYLLHELSKIKINHENVFLKESIAVLAHKVFTDIEVIIANPNEAFYDFLEEQKAADVYKKKPGQSLAFFIYNLGQLANAFLDDEPLYRNLPPLSAQRVQHLFEHFNRLPEQTAKSIGNISYGLMWLAKNNKLRGKVDALILQQSLQLLIESPDIDSLSISNGLYSTGQVACFGHLTGQIRAQTIKALLDKLATQEMLSAQIVSNSISGAGLLAEANHVTGEIPAKTFEVLLDIIATRHDTSVQSITSSIYSVLLFILAGHVTGKLPAKTFEKLFDTLTLLQDLSSRQISKVLYNAGLFAKAGYITNKLAAKTLETLFHKLTTLANVSSQENSNSIYGAGLLFHKGHVTGAIAAHTFNKSLDTLATKSDSNALSINNTMYGLRLIATAGQLKGVLPFQLILNLVTKFIEFKPQPREAREVLKSLMALMNQNNIKFLEALGSPIKSLIEIGVSSYTHPTQLADLIDCLVALKKYHVNIDDLFTKLVKKLNVPFSLFNASLQAQLLANIESLTDRPSWQKALQQALGLVPQETGRGRLAQKRHEAHSIQTPPSRPRASTSQSATPHPQPIIERQWAKACCNKIFNAIANQNEQELRELVALVEAVIKHPASTRSSNTSPYALHANTFFSSSASLSKTKQKSKVQEVDTLVKDFFTTTPSSALLRLSKISQSKFFEILLQACSNHTRYQLAKNNNLHPVLIYLPIEELQSLVERLSDLELYRDHKALLRLVDALVIRTAKEPDMPFVIVDMQHKLLDRALEFHIKSNHQHVRARLQKTKELLNEKILTMLEDDVEENIPLPTIQSELLRPRDSTTIVATPSQNQQPQSGALAINPNYEYSSEDIQAILVERLKKDYSDVVVLAATSMNENANGNRVTDVLQFYLTMHPLAENQEKTFVLPIEIGAHWVGLKIQLSGHKLVKAVYFNSKKSSERDNPLMDMIKKELHEANLIDSTLQIQTNNNTMQQPVNDGKSCGAYLVENFYCDLKNQWWDLPNNTAQTAKAIRNRHLDILKTGRPDYAEIFLTQQQTRAPLIPNLPERQQAHGINPFFSHRNQPLSNDVGNAITSNNNVDTNFK